MNLNLAQVEPQVKHSVSKDAINLNEKMAMTSIACIAQNYASSGSESLGYLSRKEYLKQARKKYFFKDPSLPSFRLFKNEDDNDKYIEEPELWRPLGANSQNQDENDKTEGQFMEIEIENNYKNQEENYGNNEQQPQLPLDNIDTKANSSYAYSTAKVSTPAYKTTANSDFEFSSIQCAQQ